MEQIFVHLQLKLLFISWIAMAINLKGLRLHCEKHDGQIYAIRLGHNSELITLRSAHIWIN